jgi:hypothetical protein
MENEAEAEAAGSAPGPGQGQPRNIFLRIFFGFLWFIGLRIVTSAIIGAVVGGIAGANHAAQTDPQGGFSENFQTGVGVGAQASMDFTRQYGLFVLIGQVLLFVVLCYFRILPGVGKYKAVKR